MSNFQSEGKRLDSSICLNCITAKYTGLKTCHVFDAIQGAVYIFAANAVDRFAAAIANIRCLRAKKEEKIDLEKEGFSLLPNSKSFHFQQLHG